MILAYGAAIGGGMIILLLLSVSFLLMAILAGRLAFSFASDPTGFIDRFPWRTWLLAILSVIPILLSLSLNPKLFTASTSRTLTLMFLTPAIPLGCVIGAFVCIFKLRN